MNPTLSDIEKQHKSLEYCIETTKKVSGDTRFIDTFYLQGIYHLLYFYIRHLLLKEENKK